MFYKKSGLPGENEILICTVKKILPHSIFAELNEYKNLEGMIHISEIAPGRIRNIRDYVKEGKIIVCKVLKVNKEKRHIDLSLRRVSVSLKRKKLEGYKQEKKAEKLLGNIAKKLKISLEDIYKKAGNKIIEKYDSITSCFQEILLDKNPLKELKIPVKIINEITKTVKEKIKLPEAKIESILTLSDFSNNGIEKIKKSIKKAEAFAKQKNYKIKITYLGAPKYNLTVKSSDYKTAENITQEIANIITQQLTKEGGHVEWQKKS